MHIVMVEQSQTYKRMIDAIDKKFLAENIKRVEEELDQLPPNTKTASMRYVSHAPCDNV